MFLTLTTKFHFISPSSGFLRQQVLWQNHMSHISIIQCNITWVIDGVCHGVKLLVVSVNPWKNIKSQSLSSGSSTLILKQDPPCLHLPCGTATPATPSLPLLYSQRVSGAKWGLEPAPGLKKPFGRRQDPMNKVSCPNWTPLLEDEPDEWEPSGT